MASQLFLNNFEVLFIAAVAETPLTGTPATEVGYGILRLDNAASGVLINPTGGDYYVLTAFKRIGNVESHFEIMKVTAVDLATAPGECRITVSRAQEGTIARAYVTGDFISLRWTKSGAENVVQRAGAETLTNKTISLASNTLTGTKAQFNTAVSDADLASAGANSDITSLSAITSINSGPLAGFKNRILNSGMAVDQRNLGALKTVPVATETYVVDRWSIYTTGAGVTAQQVASGVASRPFVLNINGAASVSSVAVYQKIEALSAAGLAGGNAVLSVVLANTLLTTVNWSLSYANASDTFSGVTAISSGSFTVTSGQARYSTPAIAIPSGGSNGLQFQISVGAQTSGQFVIGDAQLEPGSITTTLEFRPYSIEKCMCQRYEQKFIANGSYIAVGATGVSGVNTKSRYLIQYVVTPRVYPTGINTTTPANFAYIYSGGSLAVSAISFVSSSSAGVVVEVTHGASTLGYATQLYGGTNDYIEFTGMEL